MNDIKILNDSNNSKYMNNIKILEKLDKMQLINGLSNRDLAYILEIAESYLCNIRRKIYISRFIEQKFIMAIKILEDLNTKNERPIFQKEYKESIETYKKRKKLLLDHYRNLLKTIE